MIAVFDVDRTLLRGDCLHMAARRSRGPMGKFGAALSLLPSVVSWQLGRKSTDELKERTLALFRICEVVNREEAAGRCDWLLPELQRHLRPAALERLRWHQQRGDRVVLCSASPRMLLQPLADWLCVDLLATELKRQQGRWQPLLAGPNCKGPEKVRRLAMHLGPLERLTLEAYGDSKGDRELLQVATLPHYRSFRPEPIPYPGDAWHPRGSQSCLEVRRP
ncbi:MAG: HAD family hydrolase [Cyanobium sp.]